MHAVSPAGVRSSRRTTAVSLERVSLLGARWLPLARRDAARRRHPERSDGGRSLRPSRRDSRGGHGGGRRAHRAAAWLARGLPAAVGEDDPGRRPARREGRGHHRRDRRSGGQAALHAPVVHPLRPGAHGASACSARVALHRLSAGAAGCEQDSGPAQRSHVHGASHVHHGRLPDVRRAGRAASSRMPTTGRRTRPTGASRATGGLPICRSALGRPTTCRSHPGRCLQAETGPQGGHHVWIATRMKNLKQAGSITKISGLQPGTNTPIPPTTLAFTYASGRRRLLQALRHSVPARQRGHRLQAVSRQAARHHGPRHRCCRLEGDGDDARADRTHVAQSMRGPCGREPSSGLP